MSALSNCWDLIAVYSEGLYHSLTLALLSNSITTSLSETKFRR